MAAYMTANPGVKINIQAESDQGVKDKLRVLAASKTLPDIYFSWAGDFTKKFVRGNLAKDLTTDVSGAWKDSFTPAALEAYTYDGKLYGVPITLDAKYMVYNKKLFSDNGVAVPTTMEELLAACDTFKSKGFEAPITFGNVNGWPAIHYMTQLNPYYVPAATMAADYDPKSGAFTDPGYEKALQAFADLNTRCLTKGANGVTHEAAQAQLLASKSPMQYIEAVEFFAMTEKGQAPADFANNWDFFKLPAPAGAVGDTGMLEGAPDGFLVNPDSQHLDIAIDFLKFLTNAENAKKLVSDLGWLSPIQGSATADNTVPAERHRHRGHREGHGDGDLARHGHPDRRRERLPQRRAGDARRDQEGGRRGRRSPGRGCQGQDRAVGSSMSGSAVAPLVALPSSPRSTQGEHGCP